MSAMDKNLDIITYAVSLIAKALIMASGFSGRARKRSLKRLALLFVTTSWAFVNENSSIGVVTNRTADPQVPRYVATILPPQ